MLVVVAVAFRRLNLYEEAYGFTMLRLYSQIFAVWIGVVFLLFAADLAGLWTRRRWFPGAAFVTALAVAMALNAVNPETVVARLNVSRAVATHKLDSGYLGELSSDATPDLIASRSQLDAALAQQVTSALCGGPRRYSASWAAWNESVGHEFPQQAGRLGGPRRAAPDTRLSLRVTCARPIPSNGPAAKFLALISTSASARRLLSTEVVKPSGPLRREAIMPLVPQPQPRSRTRSPACTSMASTSALAPSSNRP